MKWTESLIEDLKEGDIITFDVINIAHTYRILDISESCDDDGDTIEDQVTITYQYEHATRRFVDTWEKNDTVYIKSRTIFPQRRKHV